MSNQVELIKTSAKTIISMRNDLTQMQKEDIYKQIDDAGMGTDIIVEILNSNGINL